MSISHAPPRDGSLPSVMGTSLRQLAFGLLFGTVTGTGLALLRPVADRRGSGGPPVQMLRTVPFAGLIPLFVIWFGIGETPEIAIITLGVTFPLHLGRCRHGTSCGPT
ncbi:Putative aliphatic sulfonates transport permease protein SsuC [Streptomyces cyanogenus]|uniref:Aliphatic sulfonates transport permease protein SsuC n=1 Tax=Streptomyces cyanogenus TaxID=80860 RepID=A0ABX7TM39_STRCY|nr:Putative aliphatic sulfonates transport permease protein SsuC [Streptomyces cyanogenus]